MSVGELIAALALHDPNAPVAVGIVEGFPVLDENGERCDGFVLASASPSEHALSAASYGGREIQAVRRPLNTVILYVEDQP